MRKSSSPSRSHGHTERDGGRFDPKAGRMFEANGYRDHTSAQGFIESCQIQPQLLKTDCCDIMHDLTHVTIQPIQVKLIV